MNAGGLAMRNENKILLSCSNPKSLKTIWAGLPSSASKRNFSTFLEAVSSLQLPWPALVAPCQGGPWSLAIFLFPKGD
jgi:hypothetical protein